MPGLFYSGRCRCSIMSKSDFQKNLCCATVRPMQDEVPLKDENPLAFVERAADLGMSDDAISSVLRTHYGFSDDGEIKGSN